MMTVNQIRQALRDQKIVGPKDTNGYKIYVEPAYREYHTTHFTYDADSNTVLSLRCISNYFGSLLEEQELNNLMVKETL